MLKLELSLIIGDPPPEFALDAARIAVLSLEALFYQLNEIRCEAGRAVMDCSLETRVSFLKVQVVELASGLPFDILIRGGLSKWARRDML